MLGIGNRESCRGRFRDLGLLTLTLTSLYLYQVLKFVKKNRSDFGNFASVHSYNTRGQNDIKLVNSTSTKYHSSILGTGARLYNYLPKALKNIRDEITFERELKDFLISNEFYSVDEFMNHQKTN